jgi:hypothetical protein
MISVATKNGRTKQNFFPSSFAAVVGSGMDKNQAPTSGSATLRKSKGKDLQKHGKDRYRTGKGQSMARRAFDEKLNFQELAKKNPQDLREETFRAIRNTSARYKKEKLTKAVRKNVSTNKKGQVVRINKQS